MSSFNSDSEHENINPIDPPKIPKIASSTSFVTIPTKKLQILVPSYRFGHFNIYSLVPDDLIDLFDDSKHSNEDGQRTLVELVNKNKRRRIRLLRAVNKLNGSLDKERASVKKTTNPIETEKKDAADQKKFTN